MPGRRQIHSAQNSQRQPLSLLNRRTKTTGRMAIRCQRSGGSAQNGPGGDSLAKKKQVSRLASCFLADGLEPCAACWSLCSSLLLTRTLHFLLYLANLHLPQSHSHRAIFRDPGSRNVSQVTDVVNNMSGSICFPVGMHASIGQVDSPVIRD